MEQGGLSCKMNKRHIIWNGFSMATRIVIGIGITWQREWVVAEAGKSSNCGGGLSFEFAPSGA